MHRSRLFLTIGAVALLLIAAGVVVIVATGESDETSNAAKTTGDLQTVRFQEPKDPGPDPFTEPADVAGPKKVDLPKGQGPFGGTGSDQVCDRDLLIRSLKEDPAKLKAWAEVLGIDPTYRAVAKYIAKLHPVTLTRDTPITNHSFVDGHVTSFQAILAAGTAVLVDQYGKPVARCRCGNPLTPAEPLKSATCEGCPANYHPPRPCTYGTRSFYRRYYRDDYYDNADYDTIFIERFRDFDCYVPYPEPPTVTIVDVYRPPTTTTTAPTTTTPTTTTAPSATTTTQQTTTHPTETTTPTATTPTVETHTETAPTTSTRDDACPPGYTGYNCQP
jgi:hypothetical protein